MFSLHFSSRGRVGDSFQILAKRLSSKPSFFFISLLFLLKPLCRPNPVSSSFLFYFCSNHCAVQTQNPNPIMASEKLVLAVIRAARPTFRNQNDKIAFVVHSSFLTSGYILTATGPQALCDNAFSDPSNDEVSIDHWNELNDEYAFVYRQVLVKCLVINEKLLVHALSPGSSMEFICSVGDSAEEYGGNNYSQHFKNLDKLVKKINEDVLSKLDGYANATSSRRQMKKRKNAHVQDLSPGPQAPKKLRTHSRGVVGQSSNPPMQVQTEDDLSQGPQSCKKLRKRSRGVVEKSSKLPQHAQSISDQTQEDGGRAIQSLNRAVATSTSKAPLLPLS